MLYAVVAVAVFVGLWWLTRSRTLFHLSVRDGQVLVVSGRVPSGFLADARDILARSPRGSVRGVVREDGTGLVCSGLDEGTAQRLRNVWRLTPSAALRNAPAIRKPTLGQVLGIAWLAWWLEGRTRT